MGLSCSRHVHPEKAIAMPGKHENELEYIRGAVPIYDATQPKLGSSVTVWVDDEDPRFVYTKDKLTKMQKTKDGRYLATDKECQALMKVRIHFGIPLVLLGLVLAWSILNGWIPLVFPLSLSCLILLTVNYILYFGVL